LKKAETRDGQVTEGRAGDGEEKKERESQRLTELDPLNTLEFRGKQTITKGAHEGRPKKSP